MAYLTGGKVPRAGVLHAFACWNINIYVSVYKQKKTSFWGTPCPRSLNFKYATVGNSSENPL